MKLAANKALDFETKESHVLTVRSTDGGGLFKDSTVTINVADVNDNKPTFTSAATFFVFENNGLNVGTVKATDADKSAAFNTISYSISGGADAGLFDIDGATGALKLKNAANFEAKGSYSLTVKASDGTLDRTQDVTVTVTDLNEAPNQPADVTVSVPEDSAVGAVLATVVGSDPDLGGGNDASNDFENLNYSITGGNTGNLFTIDTISGQIKLATGKALDFETAGSHVLTVRTTDGLGLWKESTVTINVTDVNEAPNKPADVSVSFAENTAAGTVLATVVGSDPDLGGGNDADNAFENLTYSITGGDPNGLFAIDSAGKVTLAAGKSLDYETATSHVLTVTTTDGPGLTKTSTVTINVTDVNDVAPVFTLAGLQTPGGTYETSAQENISTSTVVLDAAATDGDVSPNFKIITYSLTGADADKFDISSTGKVTFKASPNFDVAGDANANNIYAITVTASDGVHNVSKDVAIQLTDLNDIAPVITSGATATFAENGTGTVYTATAVDTDLTPDFRKITYSLAAGGDNDLFNINGATGAVTFKASPNFEAPLDSDKNNTYVLSVLASDGVNISTPKTVTVTVTDLVEDSGPANTAGLTITSTNATINDPTPLITGVASAAQAGQTVTLFEGTTARGTGVVQTNGTWSIESTNVGADGAHSFTAQLGSSVSNSVTLTIDTVAPVVTITGTTGTGFSPTVNGTASVADIGRTVTLFDGATAVGTGTVGAGGAFSVGALLTGTGPHTLTASVTDLAGNVGTSGNSVYTIAPQPAQGQIDSDNLDAAYLNIMDSASVLPNDANFMLDLKGKLKVNLVTYKEALDAVIDRADGSTSVATLSYQFFTGKIPTKAGMDYLVSTTGGNVNNINSAYYQDFNIENRYINFAVNLGHDGAGKDAFQTKYGALSLFDATKKAYAEIFGATPTDTKVHELLDTTFSFGGKTITRADYFTAYGHDAIGTKAAMVGWLLSEAAKADVGTYATANEAFLSDLADGATFNVDLIGTYGSKAIPLEVLG